MSNSKRNQYGNMKQRRLRRVASFVAAVFILLNSGAWIGSPGNIQSDGASHVKSGSRRLLAADPLDVNCTDRALDEFPSDILPYDVRTRGGVLLHIFITAYVFTALAILCDDYFIASIEIICEALHLQEDVAGSTFVAIGSSAPELFTSLIGLFFAKNDVGVGAIVGSAVFNLLFTIGLCGLFGGMVIQLTVWPVVRDSVCYLVTLVVLLIVMYDNEIHWYEATVMLAIYALYIILMVFNRKIQNFLTSKVQTKFNHKNIYNDGDERTPLLENEHKNSESIYKESQDKQHNEPTQNSTNCTKNLEVDVHLQEKEASDESKEEYESPLKFPDSCLARAIYVIMFPAKLAFLVTVPPCMRPGCWRKLYLLTFAICVVWIGLFSYIIVWMVTVIGDTWDIPDTVMGVTLLAVGSSLPDSINSLLVARQGLGEMAIANPIGSNIFDILIGLGLPWFLKTAAIHAGSVVHIQSHGLVVGVAVIAGTTALVLALTALNRWRVDKKYAALSLTGYIIITVLFCLFELNVFGYMNPPPCPRIIVTR